jgi:predicted RNA-binding protein with TRAM domain
MEISEELQCLFSATIDQRDGAYVIEVPDDELRLGSLEGGETYRVALLPVPGADEQSASESAPEREGERDRGALTPPVEEGEERTVEIEDIGEQGDGLARVERGFVVIVPDTETGERVRIEVTDVKQNVAFGDVQERLSYYD